MSRPEARGAAAGGGLDTRTMPEKTSPRRASYLDVEKLRALVADCRTTGSVSEPLARALLQIAAGVWDRYRFTTDKDDFVQDVALHLLGRPLEKADVQKHVFNYFTTCAIRYGLKLREKADGDRRRFATYAAELVESGRELPSRHDDAAGGWDVAEEVDAADRHATGYGSRSRRE